jgi:3-isopropylmalate dehydrogenase
MKTYKIAVLPGDGTGPEVMREGLKVVRAASKKFQFALKTKEFDLGGVRYKRTGETLSDKTIADLRTFDAIYLSALGSPEFPPGVLERDILLKMRFTLDQYINLRPCRLYPGVKSVLARKGAEHIDFVVVRENTEDIYAGIGGWLKKNTADEVAIADQPSTPVRAVERLHPLGVSSYTQRNNPQGQACSTLVGKNNVLTYAFDLWWRDLPGDRRRTSPT